jgi:hypothetical protein
MLSVFPPDSTLNIRSTQLAAARSWAVLRTLHPEDEWTMIQQDLVGFFNSVPHYLILDAVAYTVHVMAGQSQDPYETQCLQVSHRQDRNSRMFRGRTRFAATTTKPLYLQDIHVLVQFLLERSYFTVGRQSYVQTQGASMGSPLAPVVCSLVAACRESLLMTSFRTQLQDRRLSQGYRYADNRVFFLPTDVLQDPWAQVFLNLAFYQHPITLENVPGEQLLGTITSVVQGSITMQQPEDPTAIRTNRSAGHPRIPLSGYLARLRTILRVTRPFRLIPPQIEDLTQIYMQRGFTFATLKQARANLTKF